MRFPALSLRSTLRRSRAGVTNPVRRAQWSALAPLWLGERRRLQLALPLLGQVSPALPPDSLAVQSCFFDGPARVVSALLAGTGI